MGGRRLDVMDNLNKRVEEAYDKLYAWVQKQVL